MISAKNYGQDIHDIKSICRSLHASFDGQPDRILPAALQEMYERPLTPPIFSIMFFLSYVFPGLPGLLLHATSLVQMDSLGHIFNGELLRTAPNVARNPATYMP